MLIKRIVDEDLTNYKCPSMLIAMPRCTFKCGETNCQNSPLANETDVVMYAYEIISRYKKNNLTKAILFAGLEPLDSWEDVKMFIQLFREKSNDDIVIYTGYNKCEIQDKVRWLQKFKNIIMKFGRYVPGQKPHYDCVLGVELASDNQYAEKIS